MYRTAFHSFEIDNTVNMSLKTFKLLATHFSYESGLGNAKALSFQSSFLDSCSWVAKLS